MFNDLFITILCSLTISFLGLIILVRNPTQKINRNFAFLALSITLWTVLNLLDGMAKVNVTLSRFVFFGGVITAYSLILFMSNFPKNNILNNSKLTISALIVAICMSVVVFLPGFIHSVTVDSINTSYLYPLFIIYALLSFLLISFVIYKQFKAADDLITRKQVFLVSTGIVSYALLALISNVVIPYFSNSWSSSRFGPLFSLLLVALVAYSMLKTRLFDVKFVVVRSVAYLLALLTIAIISFEFLTNLSDLLVRYNVPNSAQRSLFVALTIILAVSYQPFKKLFDRLTRRFFYRDAYETQELINEFNETIVSTIDLEQLLDRSGIVIDKYLKPDMSAFAIRDSEGDTVRLISSDNPKLSKEVVEQLRGYVHKSSEKLLVTDALDEADRDLKLLMQEANIGMLARITTDAAVEGSGYVIMGYKKSGNMYNSQDMSAMEIMANELAIAIQNALQFEEIQKFTVTLQETVEEKTRQLRKSNEKLKQMDETKDEFISMASHQLRTPLTSVKGYVSMVIEGDAGELNDMQKKLLDQAFVSSQRMVYLIADLLNVSRLRTGKFVIDSSPTNLADVIQGEVDQLVETAASRDLELTYKKPDKFPTLLMDETKIRQVVMNFIDNAIYYTPAGGHITVQLKETDNSIEYTVTDDGLGVPKAQQHHLFSKFFRAENAKKARPDGTGLGLFMAKKVIVAQGGSIIFTSSEGKGSTFGFSFAKEKLLVPDDYEAPAPLNGIKYGPGATPSK